MGSPREKYVKSLSTSIFLLHAKNAQRMGEETVEEIKEERGIVAM